VVTSGPWLVVVVGGSKVAKFTLHLSRLVSRRVTQLVAHVLGRGSREAMRFAAFLSAPAQAPPGDHKHLPGRPARARPSGRAQQDGSGPAGRRVGRLTQPRHAPTQAARLIRLYQLTSTSPLVTTTP
jgi:hypothetical protein